MKIVIGLSGLIGSGKSAAAEILVRDFGFVRMKFAGPIKDMLRAIGLSEREIEGDLKEVPCDLLCGQAPRHAMITLGTEWGRNLIGQSFWSKLAVERANRSGHERIVFDDCRFLTEAHAIRSMGGSVWLLVGRAGLKVEHVSEREHLLLKHDHLLDNSGSIDDLGVRIERSVVEVFGMLPAR